MKKILCLFLALLLFSAPVDAASKYTWSEKTAPNYVVKIGKAKVKARPKKGTIKYSKPDKYGRTRKVVGTITYGMVKKSAGWREPFAPNSDPSGWGKNKIVQIPLHNGKIYRGYAWNRSHLIADSLGGRAIRRNLITGTRTQNVGANDGKGGMAYTERKAVNWLYKHHKGTIYYCATPVYKKKELLPRSVVVDIQTSDKSINERVIVYNAAKGMKINYKTGSFTGGVAKEKATTDATFIINVNTKKFHLPTCSSVSQMSEKNKKSWKGTIETLKKEGYQPCKNCIDK